MGGEWTTIGEVAYVFDGPHATPKKIDDGPYFLSISSLENGKLDLSKSARVSEEQFVKWTKRVTPREGDVLFSYETRLGEAALMSRGIRACLGRRMGLLRPDTNKVDPGFLLFAYLGPDFQREIRARTNSGATVDRIALKELPQFPIRIPRLAEQKSIAHILGSLDDKIELNHQMNATLEVMAQALFKSWFVDFDPVIDNALAAGNPIPESLHDRAETRKALGDKHKPLPEAIQKQFPSRFVFSEEMGWIPAGWSQSNVGEKFEVTMGQSPPGDTYNQNGEGLPFFQGRADFGFRYPSNRVFCSALKRFASKGDTQVSVRAPVGDVNMAAEYCCIGRGVSATRHKSGSRSYTYYSMLQLREHLNVYEAEGTVFGSINQKDFKALPQLSVPLSLVQEFESHAGSLDGKIKSGAESICCLTQLRDTLLPKLLSGEPRIPDAEKIVQETI